MDLMYFFDLILSWPRNNLDVVFFIYGLAFLIMGVAILTQPKKGSKFKLANILWLLALFGLTHGTNELLDMWAMVKGKSPVLDAVRWFMLVISYIFLFEFGRRIFYLSREKRPFKWLSSFMLCFILVLGFSSADFWKIGGIWARYLLGLPGGILTAFGFYLYYKYKEKELKPLKVKKYFLLMSASFLVYGILGGLIVPKANFFPSSWLNTDSFLSVMHIPVQVFRALCAISSTFAIVPILSIFNWETARQIQDSLELEKKKAAELEEAYNQLKEMSNTLIQAEKMAALGQLASGMAHEINNPLFVISGEAEMLFTDKDKDKGTKDASRVIIEQSKRIKGLVESVLKFSRKKELKKKPLNVNDVVETTFLLLSYRPKIGNIEIVKELDPNLPKILGDENQIQEVFLNIVLNAVDAMEKRGRLTVKTHSEKVIEYGRRMTDKFRVGAELVVIEFKDTGKGMDEEMLKKIFDVFFSTKENGTGLGLSICHGIIEAHQGIIEAFSKLGEGSTFVVKLPIYKEVKDEKENFSNR